jgi:hypothetical protein
MEKEKTKEAKYANKGDKIKVERCPHCKDELVVRLAEGKSEVLECKNCKFVIKKTH